MRVDVKPELLRWACERAGFATDEMAERIPALPGNTRRHGADRAAE